MHTRCGLQALLGRLDGQSLHTLPSCLAHWAHCLRVFACASNVCLCRGWHGHRAPDNLLCGGCGVAEQHNDPGLCPGQLLLPQQHAVQAGAPSSLTLFTAHEHMQLLVLQLLVLLRTWIAAKE